MFLYWSLRDFLFKLCVVLGVGVAVLLAVSSAAADGPSLRIPRVTRPPKIEDFLSGTPREAEVEISEFRQREPGDGTPISQDTRGYLSYDDDNLYVVFVCKDEPEKVRARMGKREDIFSDDRVGIFLDTFHDRQRYYNFLSNPLGIQADGITTEGQGNDYSFDTLWYSKGQLTTDGFIVWMAIPFKSLRFPNSPTQTWGVALGRILPRNSELSYWPFITRRVEGFTQQLATLEGLERISPGRNLQFIPYGMFARARFLDTLATGGPAFLADTEARMGLDAKIVLRDALTLDIALNPDFSQVESDEPQVTINQRFEVYFPEKRPFFIENAGFFQTPASLFFSRRIADPQFGVRLTGKVRRWGLGALIIDDRAPGKSVPKTDPLYGERAGVGIVRVWREFAAQSGMGFFVSSRDFAGSSNRLFSLDTRLKLSANWVLTGQIVRSYTRGLSGQRLVGPAYLAHLSRTGRHFSYSGNYVDRSPDFRSSLGFIPRVDIRQTEQTARYLWRPQRSRVLAVGPDLYAMVNWDRQGRMQDWQTRAIFWMELTGQTLVRASRYETFELFQDRGFRKHVSMMEFYSQWLKWMGIAAWYSQGTRVNYFPPTGLAPFLADAVSSSATLSFRPAGRILLEQTYLYYRLVAREGSTPSGFSPGTSILNNHLLRLKLNYQVNRELSLRAIFDYNAELANTQLLTTQRPKRFTADFLVTYLLHPGTALYVGYTDRYENLTLDPTVPPSLQRTTSPTTSTGRQFFVKMSYLFRF